jgi:glycosyltransferase involved in cell wall biosynthesis
MPHLNQKLRIAIDARFLNHPQVGGFKTYTSNLIHALGAVDRENEYRIYVDRLPDAQDVPQCGNFSYRVVKGSFPILGWPVREQVGIRRIIERERPDVVHFLCNTAPVGLSCNYVVTLHDTIQLESPTPFRLHRTLAAYKRWAMHVYSRWCITGSAQNARRIITVSNSEKKQIMRHFKIEAKRICVIPLAPDQAFVEASPEQRTAWRIEAGARYGLSDPIALCVGYEERKNVPFVMDVIARLSQEHPGLSLVIVAANRNKKKAFQQMARKKAPGCRIVVLEAVPPPRLAALYNIASVFLFPSEREGFGLPPLEALACATPTVALNRSSLPEVLQNGALLIDNLTTEDWACAINRIFSCTEIKSDLRKKALQRAAEFSWDRCALQTIEVYRAVAAKTS